MMQHERTAFITLTYDEKSCPLVLQVRDLQLWYKRFRKALGANRPIRHFSAGEYGGRTERPHYHALVFGASEDDRLTIDRTWGMGRTQCLPVTPQRIAYVAGYTRKKVLDRFKEHDGVVDPETGEWMEWIRPFTIMSRGGRTGTGIASNARERFANGWQDYAVHNGYRLPVPKYLHSGWEKTVSLEEQEANKLKRRLKAVAHSQTREQLHARELMQQRKQEQWESTRNR